MNELNVVDYVAENVTPTDNDQAGEVVTERVKAVVEKTSEESESKELIVTGNLVPADVFKKDSVAIDQLLNDIKSQVRAEVFDISTEKGRTRIRSVARQIGSAKSTLKKMGQGLTEDWKAQTKIVTAIAKGEIPHVKISY